MATDIRAYTMDETAKILRVSRQTVSQYIRSGQLKARKVGRAYRITEEAINDFLKPD